MTLYSKGEMSKMTNRRAKHLDMDFCDFCNGRVYETDNDELECIKCGTIFKPVISDKNESNK